MTPGFHWFVAWRYLMARPRKVSAVLIAVAGLAFIVSAVVGVVASQVLERAADTGFTSMGAYRSALVIGVVLGGVAALAFLCSAVSYARRYPERLGVPIAAGVGLCLVAGGAIAHTSSDAATHAVATVALALGAVSLGLGLLQCWRGHRKSAEGPLVFAGLMMAAVGAVIAVAEYAVKPVPLLAVAYRSEAVLLPSLGLLLLGVAAAMVMLVRTQLTRRLARAAAVVSAVLIAASAAYAVAASHLLDEPDLLQYDPPGARFAIYMQWASVVVLAAAGWGLARALVGHARSQRTSGRVAGRAAAQIHAALLGASALALAFAVFVLPKPDMMLVAPISAAPSNQGLLLMAVAALALGELTAMLGLIRYLFTFFTTVSIAGVAVGTMALVIVLSVMSGFETDLRNKILGSNAHALITKDEGRFSEYREVAAKVADVPDVVATTPYLTSEVVIAANNNYSNVVIKGVDPATVGDVTELDENSEHPQALERLWPLAEDGGILGPPQDAGVAPAPGPDTEDGGGDGALDSAGEVMDPPPPDLQVDIDEPMDFSGQDQDAAGLDMDTGMDTGDDTGEVVDPPPPDLQVDIDEPMDFSGQDQDAADMDVLDDDLWQEDDGLWQEDDPWQEPGDAGVKMRPWEESMGGILGIEDVDGNPRIPPRVAKLPGVLVGKELVKQIHLYVGQEVRIVSPLAEDTPAGPVPRTRYLRVADIFYSGMYEYDFKFVYVPLTVLQAFLDLGDQVTGIEVRVEDPDETEPVLAAIRDRLPDGYRVQDWKQINRSLFSALKLEKIAMFLVLAIIILVASFSIVGNLIMVVVEKAKEIALIKTLGASNRGIMRIFIAQGFFIGVAGTAMGVLHGLIACVLGTTYGLPIDPEVYYIDRLPIHVEIESVLAVTVAGVLISVIATLHPAYIGAKLRPIEGLRYE